MFIDIIPLPGLETEVAHVIMYIETIRWAVNSFEIICVSLWRTSWAWLTASCVVPSVIFAEVLLLQHRYNYRPFSRNTEMP